MSKTITTDERNKIAKLINSNALMDVTRGFEMLDDIVNKDIFDIVITYADELFAENSNHYRCHGVYLRS